MERITSNTLQVQLFHTKIHGISLHLCNGLLALVLVYNTISHQTGACIWSRHSTGIFLMEVLFTPFGQNIHSLFQFHSE